MWCAHLNAISRKSFQNIYYDNDDLVDLTDECMHDFLNTFK